MDAKGQDLPQIITNQERIARNVFHPLNINPNTRRLKTNFLKPPKDSEDISVNRFDYTNASFLKKIGLSSQNPKYKKLFFGIGIFKAQLVRDNHMDIIYSPLKNNPYHADLKIGYKTERGKPLPAKIASRLKRIIKETHLYMDKNINSEEWTGDEIS